MQHHLLTNTSNAINQSTPIEMHVARHNMHTTLFFFSLPPQQINWHKSTHTPTHRKSTHHCQNLTHKYVATLLDAESHATAMFLLQTLDPMSLCADTLIPMTNTAQAMHLLDAHFHTAAVSCRLLWPKLTQQITYDWTLHFKNQTISTTSTRVSMSSLSPLNFHNPSVFFSSN